MKRQSRYFKCGLTVFLTVSAILLLYDTFFGSKAALSFGAKLLSAIQPILYGALIAYLLAPVVNFFERELFVKKDGQLRLAGKKAHRGVRAVSLLLTWLLVCMLGYLLASFLLPELYSSILQLISNVENYYNTINGWVQRLLESNPKLESWVAQQMDIYFKDIQKWLTTELLPQATVLMGAVSGGVVSALLFLKDLLVGIIVSVYLLATKEQCAAYARKVIFGLVSPRYVHWVLRGIRKTDHIFSGFVRGKLLDSLIIGIICFFGCSLLHFPYTPLVSVIVGVTNVIPFFGPFLGAIPSIFLILLVSPIQALYFALFVLALQQLDGNIIGPLILGDKTGLSSLWVIIAILVGGSFFGVAGMFFGVPVCACLYCALTFFVDMRLRKKDLPIEIDAYRTGAPNHFHPPEADSPSSKPGTDR
ncbi:Predicted PurR-regulated permease PerM [Oscillibacter sp. PC13]|uniref:AI-2E family transporter n=1 Tax=Oscillibacter sp. PC13 TaxID=1855299 RepID=UPI0008EEE205|nr:AI-2E family transporter [Oscillibacter sp. PC13]SFQ17040.1 Predicted PurR-regulated permease PerM [Oscillibacter sp. PC13]